MSSDLITFPVLAALARKPMTARELSKTLLISRNVIYKRLNTLEAQHLVVKRHDKRWVPIVSLKFEAPEETYRRNAQEGTQEAPREAQAVTPTLTPPPPKKKLYEPDKHFKPGSPQAEKVAKHFRVPVRISQSESQSLQGLEASVGALARCSACKERTTPLKYGNVPICPICARKDQRE